MLISFLRLNLNRFFLAPYQRSLANFGWLSQIAFVLLLVVMLGTLTACTVSQQPPDVCSGKYCELEKPVKPLPEPAS